MRAPVDTHSPIAVVVSETKAAVHLAVAGVRILVPVLVRRGVRGARGASWEGACRVVVRAGLVAAEAEAGTPSRRAVE